MIKLELFLYLFEFCDKLSKSFHTNIVHCCKKRVEMMVWVLSTLPFLTFLFRWDYMAEEPPKE